MLSSIFLIYKILQHAGMVICWFVLAFVKGFVMLLLWIVSPQQAQECLEEMEAGNVHEQR